MKTAISIADALFKEADRLARKKGISRSELYATAIKEYIRQQRGEAITEALNNLYSKESSEIDPALLAAQLEIMPKEKW